ncbi:YjgN family protein [Jannaschia donghaensis]|uniref:Inner membrane protein YjgN n=1 Tax=Jannaschia donghaensis TaxID=420998 RepID=A0A0M6YGC5_9RHOB|nr:YjgN family protein [Jannaschia donghaensis]CTQ49401.1 Inner membrane protein YjgN [Jannaschia donghaensis]
MTPEHLDFKQVQFTGRTGEWFGIWIVNLLLSIITIGIYSAWAKVRQKRYFYGNTTIDGRAFDYHATGGQILIGRLIVIGVFILISLLTTLNPLLIFVVYLAAIFVVPWLLIRSARFNARNTSWSNVRFNFSGDYGDAIATFVLFPILVAVTLYTTIPLLTRKAHRFYVGNHMIGGRKFAFDCNLGPLYKAFGLAALWVIAVFAIMIAIGLAGGFSAFDGTRGAPSEDAIAIGTIGVLYGFLFVGFFPAVILYRALVRNVVYANTVLDGGHRFASTTRALPLLGIAVTNTLAVILTLGLALPWTQIRMTRYLADNTFVAPNGSLDAFVGQIEQDRSAVGDAFSDIEGIDIGGVGI